jgi:flagella basal body P-ring formation protein FlgA
MPRTLALLSLLALAPPAPSAAQADATVPPGLEARVGAAIARGWGVDSAGLVLSWGRGSLVGIPESSPFRLLGGGEGGWFALLLEPSGGAPAAVRLRAGSHARRQVAARAVAAGQSLEQADIREETTVRWGPPGPPAPVVEPGWVARRRMAPGALLDAAHVGPAPAVSAGQPVRVHWREGGVSVALDGVALHDAALGAPVRVRTGRSRGVVRATVIAPGEARMN